jgi:hypothetical protein
MIEEISTPDYSVSQGLITYDATHGGSGPQVSVGKEGKIGSAIGGFFGKIRDWFKSLLP